MTTHARPLTGPATQAQIDFLRHLMGQFEAYTADGSVLIPAAEEKLQELAASKQAASDAIGKLLAGGATDRRPKSARQRHGKRRPGQPTERQVEYAAVLVARAARDGSWHDSDMGQAMDPPTMADLKKMSAADLSYLIQDLKS